MKKSKRLLAIVVSLTLVLTMAFSSVAVSAMTIKPKKMSIKASATTLQIGKKATVNVKSVSPKEASKAVTYKSSKKSVATVSSKGTVTAKKVGTAKITVTSKVNKKLKKSVTIKVVAAPKLAFDSKYVGSYTSNQQVVYNGISAKNLHNQLNSKPELAKTLVDVRGETDYTVSHIKGAVNCTIPGDKTKITAAQEEALAKLVKTRGTKETYTLLCYSGQKCADNAQEILRENGVPAANIVRLIGGMGEWKLHYAMEGTHDPAALDRKEQIGTEKYVLGADGTGNFDGVKVDKNAGKITIEAEMNDTVYMNGKESDPAYADVTHHIVVNKNGSNGDACLFPTDAKPAGLYYGLLELGAKPDNSWNNLNKPKGFITKGTPVNITFSWKDGQNTVTKTMDQIVQRWDPATKEVMVGDAANYVPKFVFTGNVDQFWMQKGDKLARNDAVADESGVMNISGCITCTFSCWIGVCSNSSYGYGTEEVKLIRDELPPAGTPVTVTYTLAD